MPVASVPKQVHQWASQDQSPRHCLDNVIAVLGAVPVTGGRKSKYYKGRGPENSAP